MASPLPLPQQTVLKCGGSTWCLWRQPVRLNNQLCLVAKLRPAQKYRSPSLSPAPGSLPFPCTLTSPGRAPRDGVRTEGAASDSLGGSIPQWDPASNPCYFLPEFISYASEGVGATFSHRTQGKRETAEFWFKLIASGMVRVLLLQSNP